MGQPGFYSLTWAHKVRFPGGGVSSNPKKKKLYFILIYFNVFLCVLKLLYAFLKKVL
jgi:hypothetical protein